jgi:hypothetical protein
MIISHDIIEAFNLNDHGRGKLFGYLLELNIIQLYGVKNLLLIYYLCYMQISTHICYILRYCFTLRPIWIIGIEFHSNNRRLDPFILEKLEFTQ